MQRYELGCRWTGQRVLMNTRYVLSPSTVGGALTSPSPRPDFGSRTYLDRRDRPSTGPTWLFPTPTHVRPEKPVSSLIARAQRTRSPAHERERRVANLSEEKPIIESTDAARAVDDLLLVESASLPGDPHSVGSRLQSIRHCWVSAIGCGGAVSVQRVLRVQRTVFDTGVSVVLRSPHGTAGTGLLRCCPRFVSRCCSTSHRSHPPHRG